MYIKSIISAALLAALGASPASAIATGWAWGGECDEDMKTEQDCYDKCKSLSTDGWSGSVIKDSDGNLFECECRIPSTDGPNSGLPAENLWICTVPVPEHTPTNGMCEDMKTAQDCYDKCKSLSPVGWIGSVIKDSDGNLIQCQCTIPSSDEPIWTCTVPVPEPTTTNGNCDDLGITTWDQCQSHCASRDIPRASRAGAAHNISRCTCWEGTGMTNRSFECTRQTTESYLRSN